MPNFELWHSCHKRATCKLFATARGWHRCLRVVVTMWAEFHAVYWQVHLHDTRLITHEIRNWNKCFKDSTSALYPRSLFLLSSQHYRFWHVIICTSIKKENRIRVRTQFYLTCKNSYMFRLYICSHHQAGYRNLNKKNIKYNTTKSWGKNLVFYSFLLFYGFLVFF